MQLYYGLPSPFSRKARMIALEKGLADIEHLPFNPFERAEELRGVTPAGKVPVLVLEDRTCLFDSPVICEYLDTLGDEPRFFPGAGAARWEALRRQALADSVMEAAVGAVQENNRPEDKRLDAVRQRLLTRAADGLDALEREIDGFPEELDISGVSVICAVDFLDFRRAVLFDWRQGRPKLERWRAKFDGRKSISATAPPV